MSLATITLHSYYINKYSIIVSHNKIGVEKISYKHAESLGIYIDITFIENGPV